MKLSAHSIESDVVKRDVCQSRLPLVVTTHPGPNGTAIKSRAYGQSAYLRGYRLMVHRQLLPVFQKIQVPQGALMRENRCFGPKSDCLFTSRHMRLNSLC